MGRRRDQADRAAGLTVGEMVGADRHQPGELPLAARVGLQADPVVAGDLGQPVAQLGDQFGVAGRGRRVDERVQAGEARVADRLHRCRGVELHGAGAQRDHAAVEREVAVGEGAKVAHQLGLAAVGVEHRVAQVVDLAMVVAEAAGDLRGEGDAEGRTDGQQDVLHGVLTDADPHPVGVDQPQVHPRGPGRGNDLCRPSGRGDGQRVEEALPRQRETAGPQGCGQSPGAVVKFARDPGKTLRAVVHRVATRCHGQQHLGGADVGGGLLAADVLLAGLEGEAESRHAVGVLAQADHPSG